MPLHPCFADKLRLLDVRQVMPPGMLHGFLLLPASLEPVARIYDLLAATVHGAQLG